MSSILDTVGGTTFVTGFQGQLTGLDAPPRIETRVNENATSIDLGAPVCRGVAVGPGSVGNCKPAASAAIFIGISARALSELQADSTGAVKYAQFKDVPVLKVGEIWALAVENVTEGDDIIAVVATQTGLGGTTGGAADGTTRLALAKGNGVWQQTVASGSVGLVRINCA